MKCYLGISPVKSLNIRKLDVDTNDATIVASDMQSGSIAYAKGQKVTGTGKAFAFASYGNQQSNVQIPVPGVINVIEIACVGYPLQSNIDISNMNDIDFTIEQTLGHVTIDSIAYPITAVVTNNNLVLSCDKDIAVQLFYGKDDHV